MNDHHHHVIVSKVLFLASLLAWGAGASNITTAIDHRGSNEKSTDGVVGIDERTLSIVPKSFGSKDGPQTISVRKQNPTARLDLGDYADADFAKGDGGKKGEGRQQKPLLVLHIGPHKTGTTSLQAAIHQKWRSLEEDGYHRPWKKYLDRDLASCFWLGDANFRRTSCDDLLKLVTDLGRDGKDVVLSAEAFASIWNANKLKAAFDQTFRIRIVYFFRWYHDWLYSDINQRRKSYLRRKLDRFGTTMRDNRGNGSVDLAVPFVQYYGQEAKRFDVKNQTIPWHRRRPLRSYDSYTRYRETFADVRVIDYEDRTTSLFEKLFCLGLDHAPQTCRFFHERANATHVANAGVSLDHARIAYGAHQLGMASYESRGEFEDAVERIRAHQEEALGRASTDFPKSCVSRDVLERIYESTINHRRRALDRVPFTKSAEKRFGEKYWKDMEGGKSCDTNVTATLEMTEWQDFFEQI